MYSKTLVSKSSTEFIQEFTGLLSRCDKHSLNQLDRLKNTGLPVRFNGARYGVSNASRLLNEAAQKGHKSHIWMTSKQAEKLGGQIKPGERGTSIKRTFRIAVRNSASSHAGQSYIYRSTSHEVFNVDQIDGLPFRFYEESLVQVIGAAEFSNMETLIKDLGIKNSSAIYADTPSYFFSHNEIAYPYPGTENVTKDFCDQLAVQIIRWCEFNGWSGFKNAEFTASIDMDNFKKLYREFSSIILCNDQHMNVVSLQKVKRVKQLIDDYGIDENCIKTAIMCADDVNRWVRRVVSGQNEHAKAYPLWA